MGTNDVINTGASVSQQNAPQPQGNIPPPPGYSAADVIDNPSYQAPAPANTQTTQAIPPPPGYSASDVIDNPNYQAPSMSDNMSVAESSLPDAGQVAVGALKGVGTTINGLGQIVNRITGSHIPDASQYLTANGGAQDVGKGIESVMEFIGGDEALKLLPSAARFGKLADMATSLEKHPLLAKLASAGVTALRGGTVGATQGAVKTGGTLGGAVEGGLGGAVGGATEGVLGKVADMGGAAGDAGEAGGIVKGATQVPGAVANPIKKYFSLQAVQDALDKGTDEAAGLLGRKLQDIQYNFHDSVRSMLQDVADEEGVNPKDEGPLTDVAANTAAAVKAKAHGLYQQLDEAAAVPGEDPATRTRFQTYDDQLRNVNRKLRESAGIDPDADGRLIERQTQIKATKAASLERVKANGVDPDLIKTADATHQKAMALGDLSKHIQASTRGLREDLSEGVNADPESLSPGILGNKVRPLYNTGRLQQALGEDRADDLLRQIESTKKDAVDATREGDESYDSLKGTAAKDSDTVKTRRKFAYSAAKTVAGSGAAFEALKYLLGK